MEGFRHVTNSFLILIVNDFGSMRKIILLGQLSKQLAEQSLVCLAHLRLLLTTSICNHAERNPLILFFRLKIFTM
jgi:hypothetical protein